MINGKRVSLIWRKTVVTAGMAVLGLYMAGCGKAEAETTAQKEFVYVPEYQALELESGIDNINVAGDTVYFTTGITDEATGTYSQKLGVLKVGEKEPKLIDMEIGENSNLYRLSVDAEGNLQGLIHTSIYSEADAAQTEENGAVVEENAEESDNGDIVEEGNEENRTEDGSGETEDAAGEENSEEDTEEVVEETTSSSSGVKLISPGVTTMATTTTAAVAGADYDYQEPISQKMELCKFSAEGKLISAIDLTDALGENANMVQFMETDKEGNIYIGCDQSVYLLDKEGKKKQEIALDNWINAMFAAKDGSILVSFYGNEGAEVHTIDAATGKLGEKISALQVEQYGNYVFAKGTDTDIMFRAGNKLYTYNFADEAPVEVLNWIDCDINSDDVHSFTALEDGRILVVTTGWDRETGAGNTELAYLTKKKGSEVPEKTLLTFATMGLSFDIKEKIIDFNKTNNRYRIEIKEYLKDYSEEGFKLATEQMNADIASGNCPDLIDLSGGNMKKYAAKGLLEDLYPYMEADPEINKEDYLENVVKAYETDGKLYSLPPRFYIYTAMAKQSVVGDKKSITLDEIIELTKSLPEGTDLYEYANKELILRNNIMMNMESYVDWNTGECKFTDEEFMKALEFANQFDQEYTYNEDAPSTATRLHDGTLVMATLGISSAMDYQVYEGMFGEPVSFVGFPTSGENGSFIGSYGTQLAIGSKSAAKEGAWEFIRQELTKEAQEKETKYNNGFPIMKSALEKSLAREMEDEYYEDAEGKKHKQPRTTWGMEDFQMEVYAASQEQVDVVKELIESADTLYQYDEEMFTIIMEEAKPYFEGQKTVKEVADIIQSRVQIYVNENR